MRVVERAQALTDRGLVGDRYVGKAGTFTPAGDTARGYDLTLLEAETLDSLSLPASVCASRARTSSTSPPRAP